MTEHPKKLSIAEALRKALVDDKDWAKWEKLKLRTKNKNEQENKQS